MLWTHSSAAGRLTWAHRSVIALWAAASRCRAAAPFEDSNTASLCSRSCICDVSSARCAHVRVRTQARANSQIRKQSGCGLWSKFGLPSFRQDPHLSLHSAIGLSWKRGCQLPLRQLGSGPRLPSVRLLWGLNITLTRAIPTILSRTQLGGFRLLEGLFLLLFQCPCAGLRVSQLLAHLVKLGR